MGAINLIKVGQICFLVAVFCFILAGLSIYRIGKLNRTGKRQMKGNPVQRQNDFNRFSNLAMIGGVVGGITLFAAVAILILTSTK